MRKNGNRKIKYWISYSSSFDLKHEVNVNGILKMKEVINEMKNRNGKKLFVFFFIDGIGWTISLHEWQNIKFQWEEVVEVV